MKRLILDMSELNIEIRRMVSKEVQKKMFENGGIWATGETKVRYESSPCLCSEGRTITMYSGFGAESRKEAVENGYEIFNAQSENGISDFFAAIKKQNENPEEITKTFNGIRFQITSDTVDANIADISDKTIELAKQLQNTVESAVKQAEAFQKEYFKL